MLLGRALSLAIELQLPDFPLQQHALDLQQGQWHVQAVVFAPPPTSQQWQSGSKCPVGLIQPEIDWPLTMASGTIAQITAL